MEYVLQARKMGVAGYLLKEAVTAELKQALHSVAQGRTYLSPRIFRR